MDCVRGDFGMDDVCRTVTRELRERLADLYEDRLVRLVLFGSRARGDEVSGSDIDVLVVLRGPVSPCEEIERTIDITAGISLEYDVVVACVFVSEDRFTQEQSPLMLNVRREGVAI
jgi:predicted nucleotidyltransferase